MLNFLNLFETQSTLKNPEQVVIYCDNRELKSKVYPIIKKRCVVRKINLGTGDYLLSSHVGVERKISRDFVQSIIDGRLFKQASMMREVFSKPVFIIEGNDIFSTEINIHPNAVRGAVAAIAVEFNMPIIWTKNSLETAEMLFSIAKREQIHLKRSIPIRNMKKNRSMNEVQEYLISGLPKINSVTAKKLLKHFRSPKKIFNASKEELQKVDGIGKELSDKILKVLTKKYEKSILEE
jgi:ERCC4-type nuclease